MKWIPVFDNGHGGVINGEYQTPGKRSPNWENGVLYEGMFNRWIVNACIKKCDYYRIPYHHISPELTDVPLTERIRRANKISAEGGRPYGISIHANAAGGTGWEIFTSVGQTDSDKVASMIIDSFLGIVPLTPRLGGLDRLGRDKEANYAILRDTVMPFTLIECGFMDNKHDYKLLWSSDFQNLIVSQIMDAVKKMYDVGVI